MVLDGWKNMKEFFRLGENEKEERLKKYLDKRIELILNTDRLKNKRMKKINGILKGFYHGYYKDVILEQPKQRVYIKLVAIDDFRVLEK